MTVCSDSQTRAGWAMGFTKPEDAKPKIPQDEGLPCSGCGAKTASQWRGPKKDFCSIGKCRKKAEAAFAATKVDPVKRQLQALAEDVEDHEDRIEALDTQNKRLKVRCDEQSAQLIEQAENVAALQRQLSQLCQFVHAHVRTAGSGAKQRPALSGLSSQLVQHKC